MMGVPRSMLGSILPAILASVLAGGCQIEDPAQKDVDRLLTTLCEQSETCRCAGEQDMNACDVRRSTWDGRLEFGRAKGLIFDAECVASVQARVLAHGCLDATTEEGHLCEGFCAVFHGNVELGEDCDAHDTVTSNCMQGSTCVEGTCVDPCDALAGLPEGALCRDENGTDFDDCAENLVCDFESRNCRALPKLGERCLNGDCTRDAYCEWNSETCQAAAQVGDRCDQIDCVSGAWCDWKGTTTCQADREQGQSCRNGRCIEGLRCDYDRDRCEAPAAEGEACGAAGCEEGFDCAEGTCLPPAEVGERCSSRSCAEGSWCDWSIERCAALPDGEGQPCPVGECGGRLWCDTSNAPEGECALRAPFGETCTGHRQCESGFCPAGYCIDLPLEGESCANANACANGLVCNGETCVTALGRGSAVCSFAGW